ncbi:MAG: tetraacyldisaccharide 4'-kinase [Bryobacteraceae bacterium]|nr:tetraacyldisaccharide 4'-kinase [Bryobacteraceae bacterium]
MISRLMYVLYWLLEALALPFIVLYLLRRGLQNPEYFRGIGERWGRLPEEPTVPGGVWFHAVSVGEVLLAAQLARAWKSERPESAIYVSTTTLAGKRAARQRFEGLAELVFYAPIDYRFAVRRVLRRLRPSAVVILETEIWPNLYREAKRSGCALLVVNGRISDKAWPRYRPLGRFFQAALQWPDRILAQDAIAAARYRALGAPRAEVGGNLKYDFDPSAVRAPEQVRKIAQGRVVWIAASTMPPAFDGDIDEDDAVLDALAPLPPEVLLILVPRKPERFDAAARKLEQRGLSYIRRTQAQAAGKPRVLLLDTVGELSATFALADVVFMGGTLAARGGHNILEPAAFGKAVIIGPKMQNFAEIDREFRAASAVVPITSAAELGAAVARFIADPAGRAAIGEAARNVAAAKRGATRRAVEAIAAIPVLPRHVRYPWLRPFTWLWRAGMSLDRFLAARRRLHAPVISVGGLSMGGAGKTPFVLWLAERLRESGAKPAILTRGYRRAATHPVVAPAGGEANRECQGDEAAIFVRRAVATVGIGADRYAVAQKIAATHFVLDDGFQHWRLQRDCDIVLIDALDPFAGGVFPSGRAREGFESLARADVVVVTRSYRPNAALEAAVRAVTNAPLFYSRPAPAGWRRWDGTCYEGSLDGAEAFCGLANPATFWLTLESLGVRPARKHVFPDHHRYAHRDFERMAAPLLLTTEKDAMNVPPPCAERVVYLEISMDIDNWPDLLALVLSKSSSQRFTSSPPP